MVVFLVGKGLFLGFAEWLFIIGVYGVARDKIRNEYSWISVLRELAMLFYLTHQQLLVPIVAGCLWMAYLGSFPVTLFLATVGTLPVSLVVTRLGPLRYFFALPPQGSTFITGTKLRGFISLLVLTRLYVTVAIYGLHNILI